MTRALLAVVISLTASLAMAQEHAVRGVHDPCIIAENGWYYVFSTGALIREWRSKDLRHWEYYGEVFDKMPPWTKGHVPKADDLWGPDIVFWKGKYYLYYCVSTFGQQLACIGLATNKTLDRNALGYKWEDQGMVIKSQPGDDFCAIDGTFFLKGGKEPWLVFGSSHDLKLVKLGQNGKLNPGSRLVSVAQRTGPIIEAPNIFEHKGWFYLFVSVDQCCEGVNSTYHIRVGRSKQLEGPYVDFANRSLLDGGGTLVLAGYGTVRGPGNNVVFRVKDQDYFVHHFYDATADGAQTLQIRPLLWGTDGWPLAGEPQIFDEGKTAETPPVAGRWQISLDFVDKFEIALLAGGYINQKDAGTTWSQRGTDLELHWTDKNARWTDRCIVGPDGNWFVGRNEEGIVIRGRRIEKN